MDDSHEVRAKLEKIDSEDSQTENDDTTNSLAVKQKNKNVGVLRHAPELPKLRDDFRKSVIESDIPPNVPSRAPISPTPMLSTSNSICNRRRIPTPLSFVESLSPVGPGSFSPFLVRNPKKLI